MYYVVLSPDTPHHKKSTESHVFLVGSLFVGLIHLHPEKSGYCANLQQEGVARFHAELRGLVQAVHLRLRRYRPPLEQPLDRLHDEFSGLSVPRKKQLGWNPAGAHQTTLI